MEGDETLPALLLQPLPTPVPASPPQLPALPLSMAPSLFQPPVQPPVQPPMQLELLPPKSAPVYSDEVRNLPVRALRARRGQTSSCLCCPV